MGKVYFWKSSDVKFFGRVIEEQILGRICFVQRFSIIQDSMNYKLEIYLSLIAFILDTLRCEAFRPVDYVAPVNPCRLEDRFCSVKCSVLQLKGDISCDFCVCNNKDDYVKWDTTPDPIMSSYPTTSLPPDVIEVNNIRYHKVGDPCVISRDRVCPTTCTETQSVKQDGSKCTMCDCKGTSVLIG